MPQTGLQENFINNLNNQGDVKDIKTGSDSVVRVMLIDALGKILDPSKTIVPDGNKGDIIVSGGGLVWTIVSTLKDAWNAAASWVTSYGTALTGGTNTTLHYHDSDRDRANHTGTQAISTVSGLQSALDIRTGHPNIFTGRGFYNALVVPDMSLTAAFATGTTQYFPFIVWGKIDITFFRIIVRVAATSGGTGIVAGIYNTTTTSCYPSTKLVQAIFDNRVLGTQTASFSAVTLQPGMYWVAIRTEATVTMRTLDENFCVQAFAGTLDDNANGWGLRVAEAYSTTLPSTAPAGMDYNTPTKPLAIIYG